MRQRNASNAQNECQSNELQLALTNENVTELGVNQSLLMPDDRALEATVPEDQLMYLVNKDGQYTQISHMEFQ